MLLGFYIFTQNEMYSFILDIVLTVGNLLATIACGITIFVIIKRRIEMDTYIVRFLLLGMIIFFIINVSSFIYNGFILLTS